MKLVWHSGTHLSYEVAVPTSHVFAQYFEVPCWVMLPVLAAAEGLGDGLGDAGLGEGEATAAGAGEGDATADGAGHVKWQLLALVRVTATVCFQLAARL